MKNKHQKLYRYKKMYNATIQKNIKTLKRTIQRQQALYNYHRDRCHEIDMKIKLIKQNIQQYELLLSEKVIKK